MRINNNNIITGVFNDTQVPTGSIYTEGDIVLKNSKLYRCSQETSTSPYTPNSYWEVYTDSMSEDITTLSQLFNPLVATSSYVTGDVLRQYLQEMYPGRNFDGTIKTLSVGTLNDIDKNSRFLLSPNWLTSLLISDPTAVPFQPVMTNEYFLTTTITDGLSPGTSQEVFEVSSTLGSTVVNPYVHQEILEVDKTNNKISIWHRVGSNIAAAPWVPQSIVPENMIAYTEYINSVMTKALQSNTLVLDFMDDIKTGRYNMWKRLDKQNVINSVSNPTALFHNDYSPTSTPVSTTVGSVILDGGKYYKIFIVNNGVIKSLYYSPEYIRRGMFSNTTVKVYLDSSDFYLQKQAVSGDIKLFLSAGWQVVEALESSKLI